MEDKVPRTKIHKAGLVFLLTDLFDQGLTEEDIAVNLTQYCAEKNITDQHGNVFIFSQSTVNRALKPIRDEHRTQTKEKIEAHVESHIESDLEAIEEAEGYHLGIARTKTEKHKTRSDAYMKMARLIFDKIRVAMGEADSEEIADRMLKEIDESLDPELKDRVNAISETGSAGRISGPH